MRGNILKSVNTSQHELTHANTSQHKLTRGDVNENKNKVYKRVF